MSAHTCHAVDCEVRCKPEYLMCGRHWRMVPRRLQAAVWDAYVPGQCDLDPRPSPEWHDAADRAIAAVAAKEGLHYQSRSLLSGEVITSGVAEDRP